MKLRTVKCWRPKAGGTRYIRLYRAWWNMQSRVKGTTTSSGGINYWTGSEIGFRDWLHFREWSLANNYSREQCSLDRIDSREGYTPDNCRWISREENGGRTAETRLLNDAILKFQQSPTTPEEQHELDEAMDVWTCPYKATFDLWW